MQINITTPDGKADCHFVRPAGKGDYPTVIMYMDVFGVRPSLIAMAERLSSSGYNVLLPNLYYRAGAFAPFNPATAFENEQERNRLMALRQSTNQDLAKRDAAAFLDYLAKESAPGSKIGCVGYCMGGAYAITAAGTFPDRVGAAATFHGGRLATDQPDSPHLLAPKIRAKVYIGIAGIDAHFSDAEKDRLKAALEAAHVRHEIEVYPGVRHGFTISDMPAYDREACERHWDRLLQLLGEAKLKA
ncbi:MAG TPA: dienelactone hydrolase family protein [Tepidisphaeraceae bacterium]|jgi:carboxymethylenebutenolidase